MQIEVDEILLGQLVKLSQDKKKSLYETSMEVSDWGCADIPIVRWLADLPKAIGSCLKLRKRSMRLRNGLKCRIGGSGNNFVAVSQCTRSKYIFKKRKNLEYEHSNLL